MAEDRAPVEYTVLEKSLIGNEIFEAGTTAKYAGLPAENLAPTCDVGRARYQEYLASNAERLARMKANDPDDSTTLAAAIAAAIAKAVPAKAAGRAKQESESPLA